MQANESILQLEPGFDPLLEVDKLVEACTCDWCGVTWRDVLKREWCCRQTGTTKHWKVWKVCSSCRLTVSLGQLIRRVAPDSLLDILSVQPMNLPSDQIFYMDFVHNSPEYARRQLQATMPAGVIVENVQQVHDELLVDVVLPRPLEFVNIEFAVLDQPPDA